MSVLYYFVCVCVCICASALTTTSEAYFKALAKIGEQASYTKSASSIGKKYTFVCVDQQVNVFLFASVCLPHWSVCVYALNTVTTPGKRGGGCHQTSVSQKSTVHTTITGFYLGFSKGRERETETEKWIGARSGGCVQPGLDQAGVSASVGFVDVQGFG